MTEAPPEWTHIVTVREASRPVQHRLTADAAARAGLAARFDLIAIDALSAEVTVSPIAGGLAVSGTLDARVTQACAATGRPVPARVSDAFHVKHIRDEQGRETVDEDGLAGVELDADSADVLPLEGERVDIAETVAQSLALALDPFPRHPDADALLARAGIARESEEAATGGPFAALKALRPPR